MTVTDPVAAGLDRRFEACCRSQAARRAVGPMAARASPERLVACRHPPPPHYRPP